MTPPEDASKPENRIARFIASAIAYTLAGGVLAATVMLVVWALVWMYGQLF